VPDLMGENVEALTIIAFIGVMSAGVVPGGMDC
jgi:hypothetical protein